ncbi:hypothetical protein H2Y56_06195 [Pectobacterium aroidearum]|uniref:Uncharacterized protein n=1 Tax=Pectobacterium aroidearum TaxID=1201031 RepID=A0ABR5ZAV4_9GAMM|nr:MULTISPECIES: hypothetical protein [Pectobacterium]MBA5198916.1 hypothetical protein [Pectobacterium aroidearum]MBA5230127.1 hypothetical protein [Pectobacterium aroidearum]MBA5231708.1 hypothetical protein [Pectobacterium aroidearum]MBA5739248.1 hypothetical protein [Pectobacterium aroidearum]UXJ99852.1 hypothetical protein N5056_19120 [Pectobacterium aroidearum]
MVNPASVQPQPVADFGQHDAERDKDLDLAQLRAGMGIAGQTAAAYPGPGSHDAGIEAQSPDKEMHGVLVEPLLPVLNAAQQMNTREGDDKGENEYASQ